jgi:hypothetical protein
MIRLDLGRTHFGAAELGDVRRTQRLVKVADTIMTHPSGTLPHKFKDPSGLEAMYRLMNTDSVTHAAVSTPHWQLTQQRMADLDLVLVVHDTTELDYSGIKSIKNLGSIGNGSGCGYLCHNSLAINPQSREVLGLVNQILHTRRKVPKNEKPAQRRDHPGRESRLWKKGCQAVGPAPVGKRYVDVCDAGADAFELLDYEDAENRSYVIRSGRDRLLPGQSEDQAQRTYAKLFAYTRGLPDLGVKSVNIRQNTNKRNREKRKAVQVARTAQVRIAAGPVTLPVPQQIRGEHRREPLNLWVVHVREVDAPQNVPPLEWVLLTNVATDTFEQASQRVDWYSCRPIIEEFHKAMKTGCGIENPQFTTSAALTPIIGILCIVAVMLLQLRQATRRPDAKEVPASTLMPALHIRVLCGWRWGKPKPNVSIYDFYLALARLGGHQNRKSDGHPGWLTLWRGWNDLHLMVLGAQAVDPKRCD